MATTYTEALDTTFQKTLVQVEILCLLNVPHFLLLVEELLRNRFQPNKYLILILHG